MFTVHGMLWYNECYAPLWNCGSKITSNFATNHLPQLPTASCPLYETTITVTEDFQLTVLLSPVPLSVGFMWWHCPSGIS